MTVSRIRRRSLMIAGAIVAVVVAIGVSRLSISSENQLQACQQEYKTVQATLDAYMAYFDLSAVTPSSTNDMRVKPDGVHPLYNPSGQPLFVLNSPTVYSYTWDDAGKITTITAVRGGPGVPDGCVVAG
jgi:YD repeat-containing protein